MRPHQSACLSHSLMTILAVSRLLKVTASGFPSSPTTRRPRPVSEYSLSACPPFGRNTGRYSTRRSSLRRRSDFLAEGGLAPTRRETSLTPTLAHGPDSSTRAAIRTRMPALVALSLGRSGSTKPILLVMSAPSAVVTDSLPAQDPENPPHGLEAIDSEPIAPLVKPLGIRASGLSMARIEKRVVDRGQQQQGRELVQGEHGPAALLDDPAPRDAHPLRILEPAPESVQELVG